MKALLPIAALLFAGCGDHISVHRMKPETACINNLMTLDLAIGMWAAENHKATNDTPTWEDLERPGSKSNYFRCPSGGTYILRQVWQPPTCSIPEHATAWQAHLAKAEAERSGAANRGQPVRSETNRTASAAG